MAESILYKAILKADEDYADDREVENAQTEAVEEATRRASPLTAEQRGMLDELRASGSKARPDGCGGSLVFDPWVRQEGLAAAGADYWVHQISPYENSYGNRQTT
jgi:hypothetical protein